MGLCRYGYSDDDRVTARGMELGRLGIQVAIDRVSAGVDVGAGVTLSLRYNAPNMVAKNSIRVGCHYTVGVLWLRLGLALGLG